MKDVDIHPVATGLAKQTVDAHQDEQELVFWSGWSATSRINTTRSITLYESDILVESLDELVPADAAHPAVFPTDPFECAWKIIPAYFRLQMAQEAAAQAEARAELYAALRTLVARVQGPYFAGQRFGAVDIGLAPFARRFYALEEFHRDSLKRTSSEDQYYTQLLRRYFDNEAESEVAKATRAANRCLEA
ncbi:hypothetical protein Q5752_002768 [Cryptotrichosporon argae]